MFDTLNVEGQEGKALLIAMGHGTVSTETTGNSITLGIPEVERPVGVYRDGNMGTEILTMRFDSLRSVKMLINDLKGIRDGMAWDLECQVRNDG